jgi:hypothetical protein
VPLPSPGGICTIIDRGSGPMVLVAPETSAPVASNSSAREYELSSGSVNVSVTDCGAVGSTAFAAGSLVSRNACAATGLAGSARYARMQSSTMAIPRTLAPALRRVTRHPLRRDRHRMSLPEGSLALGAGSVFSGLDRATATAPKISPRAPATIPTIASVRAVLAAALASATAV